MKRLGLVALALGLGVGCYPGDPTSISEFDTVLTVRNPDFAFSEALSFYMPDTIVQINEDDDDAIEIGRDNDEEILARVRSNLLAQGWTELTREDIQNGGQIPDLAIGNLNGVLAQNTGSNFDRLLDGIDQMFEQSPYLSGPTPEPAN
jgi:hypothetical protein